MFNILDTSFLGEVSIPSLLKKPIQASYNFLWEFTFRSVNVETPGPRIEPIRQLVSERHPLPMVTSSGLSMNRIRLSVSPA